MNEQKNQAQRVSNLDRVIDILNRFKPIIEDVGRLIGLLEKYNILLSEPRFLFKYRKDWIALLIASRLYEGYKTQNQLSPEYIESTIKSIKKFDPELAENVRKLLPIIKKETNIFSDLFIAYNQGRDYFIAYISTHVRELIARAKSIENKSISRRLVELLVSISGHEVDFLIRYRDDCMNWSNVRYAVNYDVNFFIRRLNLYLKGGFEGNMQFMGLYKDFEDRELSERMLANNAIKNLWRYNEQVNYLRLAIEKCRGAEKSGEWKGFYGKGGFWQEFDQFVREFAIKYGNSEFADILRSKKKIIGESPSGWGGEWKETQNGPLLVKDGVLPQLLRRLQNPQYQRTSLIIPSSSELSELLRKREEELIRTRDMAVDNLIESLHKLSGIGLSKDKVVKNFRRFLEKRKWRLSNIVKNEEKEFIAKASALFLAYDSFSKQQKIVMAKVDLDFMANKMKHLASIAQSHSRYTAIKLRTDDLLRSMKGFVDVNASTGIIEEASSEIIRLMKYDHLNEDDFNAMEKLILQAASILRSLKNFINGHIRNEVERKYIITIDDIEKLPVEINQIKQGTAQLRNPSEYAAFDDNQKAA